MSSKKQNTPKLRFPQFTKFEEWEVKKLNEFSRIIMGASPKSEFYNDCLNGLPFLQGNADIKKRTSAPRIFTSKITRECQVGDILLSVRAPVGTVAKSNHHACIGRGISAIRAKESNSQEFLYQWLWSIEPQWIKISQGGTFDAVNSNDIRKLHICVPKPKEQQKIADCLSSLDELIVVEGEKLVHLKDHKKGLMQKLFPSEGKNIPEYRFPQFKNKPAWEEKKLADVSDIITGSTPSTKEPSNYGENFMFVSPADIGDQRYVFDTKVKLSAVGYSRTRHIKKDSILFVCIGSTIGKIAKNSACCATNQQINSLIPNNDCCGDFLYSLLEFNSIRISAIAGKQAVPIINKSLFSSVLLRFPKMKKNEASGEQQKIAGCLSSLDELITAQSEKVETLKQQKKGLMQQLFPNPDGDA